MAQDQSAAPRRDDRLRIGAVVALAFAVGFFVWLVVRDDDAPTATSATTTSTTPRREIVVGATAAQLRTLAAVADRPIYWLGPRRGAKYELTQTPDGKIYIRYLPRNVAVGERRGGYPLVGTYPVEDAYEAVEAAGEQPGAETFDVARGGLAVVNEAAPTNVYFAYPESNVQVEVFHPAPGSARRLVETGAVTPIR